METLMLDVHDAKMLLNMPAASAQAVLAGDPGVSPRVAAALVRRSPRVIRQAVADGTLDASNSGWRVYVKLSQLARWAGRTTFSPTDLRRLAP